MLDQQDLDYFTARASEERKLSETADDPIAKLIHAKLSRRYESMVRGDGKDRPILHIVTR